MTQQPLPLTFIWHESRVASAESKCLRAIKAHRKRSHLFDDVKKKRHWQMRKEVGTRG